MPKTNSSFNKRNRIKHEFLLTFFDKKSSYAEKLVNGFYLVKQFRKELSLWEVAIYTKEAFFKKKAYKRKLRK
jgi:hypothetical protein